MALVLMSGPGIEPVSLAEVKAHLRLDGTAEDALLAMSASLTSRLHIESALGLALISQDWSLKIDAWPSDGVIVSPMRPLQDVTAIRVTGRDNSISELPPAVFASMWEPRFLGSCCSAPQSPHSLVAAATASRSRSAPASGTRHPTFRRRSATLCCCWSLTGTSIATRSKSVRPRPVSLRLYPRLSSLSR